jgi:LmbE family N-acetylglucosaminyl deacetylase
VLSDVLPNIVYTHFSGDLNVDHQITHKAVMTACRPQAWCSVKEIYCFEVLSATEWNSKSAGSFIPQKVVDITEQWKKKNDALACYQDEMRSAPHSRSIECVSALAMLRGATHGFHFGEAFFVERILA